MPENLVNYSLLTILWVSGLSLLGGLAGYIKKVNSGLIKRFSIVELVGELFISGFVGIVTFLLCDAANLDVRVTAALVGISGHMGSRAIFLLEQFINKKFNTVFDKL